MERSIQGGLKDGKRRLSRAEVWTTICQLKPEYLKCVQDEAAEPNLQPEDVGEIMSNMYKDFSKRIHAHVDGLNNVNIDVFGLTDRQRAALNCSMKTVPLKVATRG